MIYASTKFITPTSVPWFSYMSNYYIALEIPDGEEIRLPEGFVDERGYETFVFHAKPDGDFSPKPTNLDVEEARLGYRILTSDFHDREYVRGGYVDIKCTSLGDHVSLVDERQIWDSSSITVSEWFVRDKHIIYTSTWWWNGEILSHDERDEGTWSDWREGRRGKFQYDVQPIDPTTWCYFREYTGKMFPPVRDVEPYVGHGYPPKKEDNSFVSDPKVQYLIQHAYYEAAMDVRPKLNDNNFQNAEAVLAGLALAVSVFRKHPPGSGNASRKAAKTLKRAIKKITSPGAGKVAAKGAASAWLWYRYAYSTTKMDIEEAKSYVDTQLAVESGEADDLHYGTSSTSYLESTLHCTCRIRGRERTGISRLKGLTEKLWEYGFSPNFYVLWDSLPFSFMVDWALPVGDYFNVDAAKKFLTEEYLEIDGVCFSLRYNRTLPNKVPYQYYTRWPSCPLCIDTEFWTSNDKASTHTVQKRVNDIIAISTNFI